jgi:putative aminopeptidase FrvX
VAPAAGAVPPLLDRLLRTPGPSGFESGPVAVWRAAVEASAEVSEDALGSVLARVRPRESAQSREPGEPVTSGASAMSAPTAGIFTHIDEIGLIVKAISPEGFLLVENIGGWDPQILVGQRIEVLTASGPRLGVIGRKAIHGLTAEERKTAVALKDLRIDIGAADREQAAASVEIGDPAVIAAEPILLGDSPGGRLVSRSLDNRISAYIAAEAIRRLAESGGAPGAVVAVASVQEETTYAGARTAAYAAGLDIAVVIDVTQASDAPGGSYELSGDHRLGSGPVITRGAHSNPQLVAALRSTAEQAGIPYTLMAAGGLTATDADAVHSSRGGIPTVVLNVPLRYMHSPVEMVQLSDVEHTIGLLLAFLDSLGG